MAWVYALWRWVRVILLLYALMLVLLTLAQRRLIYFPSRGSERDVTAAAATAGLEPWWDGDGALTGFYRPARIQPESGDESGPVLVLHGNAGYAAHRNYYAQLFPHRPVYILEYPGFGARPGRPGEKSIRLAAEEALRELASRSGPVLLLGESIGSGPASWLAGAYPEMVTGAILITPFTSLVDVARSQFPFLPVGLLLRDRWNNEVNLEGFPGPLAVVVAEEDRVVPARFGRQLHEGFRGSGRLWSVPGSDHNTLIGDLSRETWLEILHFVGAPMGGGEPR
ncbi:MAG: alpha/beta hydrolase [Spirochaetaceae bacterium]|nr:MAG: alpha/beta hydrolase [Spirochaetaceae bacterium]